MRIKIICEKKGWILYRIAEELKRRLKHWDIRINEKPKKDKNIVGIDVGLKDFAVLSNGETIKRQRITDSQRTLYLMHSKGV